MKHTHKIISTYFITVFFLVGGELFGRSHAQAQDWSFEDHPHPSVVDLSTSEHNEINAKSRDEDGLNCSLEQQAQYELYLKRYPKFESTYIGSHKPQEAWLDYVLTSAPEVNIVCILGAEIDKLIEASESLKSDDFFFCGKFSRPPKTQKERDITQSMARLLKYIEVEKVSRLGILIHSGFGSQFINFHPDLLYFYQFLRDQPTASSNEAFMEVLWPPNYTIPPARKAELDAAIAKGDVQMVIDTMGNCFRAK